MFSRKNALITIFLGYYFTVCVSSINESKDEPILLESALHPNHYINCRNGGAACNVEPTYNWLQRTKTSLTPNDQQKFTFNLWDIPEFSIYVNEQSVILSSQHTPFNVSTMGCSDSAVMLRISDTDKFLIIDGTEKLLIPTASCVQPGCNEKAACFTEKKFSEMQLPVTFNNVTLTTAGISVTWTANSLAVNATVKALVMYNLTSFPISQCPIENGVSIMEEKCQCPGDFIENSTYFVQLLPNITGEIITKGTPVRRVVASLFVDEVASTTDGRNTVLVVLVVIGGLAVVTALIIGGVWRMKHKKAKTFRKPSAPPDKAELAKCTWEERRKQYQQQGTTSDSQQSYIVPEDIEPPIRRNQYQQRGPSDSLEPYATPDDIGHAARRAQYQQQGPTVSQESYMTPQDVGNRGVPVTMPGHYIALQPDDPKPGNIRPTPASDSPTYGNIETYKPDVKPDYKSNAPDNDPGEEYESIEAPTPATLKAMMELRDKDHHSSKSNTVPNDTDEQLGNYANLQDLQIYANN